MLQYSSTGDDILTTFIGHRYYCMYRYYRPALPQATVYETNLQTYAQHRNWVRLASPVGMSCPVCMVSGINFHCLNVFPSMVGKKSVGGTLFFSHLITMGKKVHFQISSILKEKKSVVHSFSPYVRWGKEWEILSFFPSVWWGKEWGVHSFSHLYGRVKEWGAHSFSLNVV